MKTESLIQKYERLKRSIPYVGFKGMSLFKQIASDNCANLKLTEDGRFVMIESEAQRLFSEHRERVAIYQSKIIRIDKAWIKELFNEFGVSQNSKAHRCYSLAYKYGHSSGYSDIYNYFSELVTLIQ